MGEAGETRLWREKLGVDHAAKKVREGEDGAWKPSDLPKKRNEFSNFCYKSGSLKRFQLRKLFAIEVLVGPAGVASGGARDGNGGGSLEACLDSRAAEAARLDVVIGAGAGLSESGGSAAADGDVDMTLLGGGAGEAVGGQRAIIVARESRFLPHFAGRPESSLMMETSTRNVRSWKQSPFSQKPHVGRQH